ncbi:disease resistance protein RPV1-like [Eucalyptus grandis]|uniref:disease resistance protein RPV1-like n=1 Tax=Eucalyptus grandis TaxID=71139 RepID=UPI00192EB6B1|nr:disease resistance protein RPV1-like [Eucalyptus grandis]
MARKLKVLNLTGCARMHKTPDLSSNVNLEQLILESCGRLVQIDESIGQLTQLVFLNLRFCRELCKLPEEIANLESLEELLIDCTSIREVPGLSVSNCSSIGNLTSLSRFSLENVEVSQPHLEIRALVKLEHLSLSGCKLLKKIPDSIWNLESLVVLNLSHTHIAELPKSLGNLKNLKILRMRGSSIRSIPSAIGMLEKLKEIDAEFCQCLEGTIPEDIGRLSSLEILKFSNTTICNIPKLPESLLSLHIGSNSMKRLPDLSNLINLTELNLEISQVPEFCLAEEDSTCVDMTELGRDPSPSLTEIQSFEGLEKLTVLRLGELPLLERLPDLSNLKKLTKLDLQQCHKLVKILGRLDSLEDLCIYGCNSLVELPDPSSFKNLKSLQLRDCEMLQTDQVWVSKSDTFDTTPNVTVTVKYVDVATFRWSIATCIKKPIDDDKCLDNLACP